METGGLTLVEAIQVVPNIQSAITTVLGLKVLKKYRSESFKTSLKVLNGKIVKNLEMQESLVSKFKFAIVTSADVEISFSRFKNILSDRRRSFTVQTLEQLLIIVCFIK